MITLPFATILFVTSQTSIHRPNPPSTSDSLSLKGGALGVGEASQAHRKKSKLGARLLLGTPPSAKPPKTHPWKHVRAKGKWHEEGTVFERCTKDRCEDTLTTAALGISRRRVSAQKAHRAKTKEASDEWVHDEL